MVLWKEVENKYIKISLRCEKCDGPTTNIQLNYWKGKVYFVCYDCGHQNVKKL